MSEFLPRKNKICYVVTIPLTIRAFFIPQLKYLAQHGYDVSVICGEDDKLQQELGDEIRYIPANVPRGLSLFGSLKSIASLYRIMKREKFDLVQYSTPNAALSASIAAKLVGVKVRNYHLMGFRYLGASSVGRMILKSIEKISCSLSTSIECVSPSNLKLGVQEGIFQEEKATVVWHGSSGGVDLKRFDYTKREMWRREVRRELGFAEEDFVFGFVGRVTRDKGINEILQAYMSRDFGAKLFLVGSEEGIHTLDQSLLAQARENPNIVFHSEVQEIERYYAAIDVLLLPSYREGFGNVVIEAAAMGTPAIVSNIPGPIDAIERDKTALTVPVRDVAKLAEAMVQMRANKTVSTGQECVEFVRTHFDSEELCKKIYARKRDVIKQKDNDRVGAR